MKPNLISPEAWGSFVAKQLAKENRPPADVLARKITHADVARYPAYFILGPGREAASATECDHGYYLTSSCPGCDADDDAARS